MVSKLKVCHQIQVCVGAGCKAWDSEVVIQNLRDQSNGSKGETSIFPTKCLNNCGGGVTIKTPLSKELIKIRKANQIWGIISKYSLTEYNSQNNKKMNKKSKKNLWKSSL